MTLTCPKCHGDMRNYERNGVHVDQCTECRGIFLDRGELEKLIDAENSWHDEPASPAAPTPPAGAIPAAAAPPAPLPATSQIGAIVGEVLQQARAAKSSSGGGYDRGYGAGSKHKKKKSFLDELFG